MKVFNMFITAVCFIFLIKLRWPKTKSSYVFSLWNFDIFGGKIKSRNCLSLSLSFIMLCQANTCTIKLQGHEITKDIKKRMTGE